MTSTKRIAILTGGGDVPGLNAVIKSVVYRATEAGYEVIGLRRGWEALTHVQPDLPGGGGTGYLKPLDRINTRADRPDGRHHPPHVADEPAQDEGRRAAALAPPRPSVPASRPPPASTT